MKIEIITIGDEILIGQIIDTNSAWMAAELTRRGFEIIAVTSIGDNAENIRKTLDIAFERADALLLTGGVGPTKDDITKKTLCAYFDTDLVFDENVLRNINDIFFHKKFKMNELTKSQAFVPKIAEVIQNKVGTAPILWFEHNKKILVSMPGVPFEMKTAMKDEIIPRLKNRFPSEDYLRRSFLVFGITESALAIQLDDFEKELPACFSLAYLPSYGLIRLRLSVRGKENELMLAAQAEKLKQLLGDLLVAEGEKLLEELLDDKLREQKLTIATAESCTGGNIAHRITLISGASGYYKGSVVSYANDVKTALLNVPPKMMEKYGAVSEQVVKEMAKGVSEKLKTDCAIAVSGIAGPDGGTPEKPVGTVWICTQTAEKFLAKKYQFGASREENINRATNMAMLQMIKML